MLAQIDIPRDTLARFCQERGIRWMALFGSVLREDFRPDSDLDVLVEFEPGRTPGYFTYAGYALELEAVFKREVDLKTPAEIGRYFRQRVLDRAETLYGTR